MTDKQMENEILPGAAGYSEHDNSPGFCRADYKSPVLPREARLPINRCNLPAVILGSPTYQEHPVPLVLDGVAELHRDLFGRLDGVEDPGIRAEIFGDYLTVHFRLEHLEEAGFQNGGRSRAKANYIRMIRGWSFDSDSREGAVLKGWVESRFGLTPRFHGEPLRDPSEPAYRRYLEMRAQGLYGTNALEAQLDLVYGWCQYEMARRHPGRNHVTLYRGVNRVGEHEILAEEPGGGRLLLLNNLNSFTSSRDRAGEFGDYILTVAVPLTKIFFCCGLIPGALQGEDEFLAVGGVYRVELTTF
jgi:NAD+--dinitrogen-reductase ADP-D-ribosyltransferase